jgi:hypothetical protein
MYIKMKAKDSKNLKKKIGLKNLFVQKNTQSFKPKNINIQTINIDKTNNYFNEDKKFFSTKNLNKIRYLNNSSIIYNINNANYLQDEEQISLFDSSGSDRVPSPIDSLKSSSYFTNTIKKRKYKRHQKKIKNNINNLSLNSNINNCNNSIFLCSSSSSDNDYSESDVSCNSRDDKKKIYYEKMKIEENELDYLKRSEVGLISSEEEDNNSVDNSNSIEENFNNEIERILIEIYNKNISIVSSGYYNYNEINKNNSEIEDIEKQIKKYLKRENFKTILLVLKSLSNKIKELVGKYKEKVFEIEDIKNIYDANQLKRQILLSNQIIHCNNSIESNVATNSNSNSPCESFNEEENYIKNNMLINVEDEIAGKGIANILLRELINIKKTLKISSKEIEGIFKYPLNILKDENGKKIKFSVELMQCEEFCKTLLNDELISTLLNQIKNIFYQIKTPKYIKLIEELEENCIHKNEMTRFVEYINNRLDDIKRNSNNNNDNDLDESNGEENINSDITENKIEKETDFSLNKSSSNESNETGKKIKRKKNNKNKSNKNEKDENNNKEMTFKDIDELLNYINEDSDSKKGKKKCRKSKKNKKQNNSIKDNQQEKNENSENSEDNVFNEDFEKEFENFKNDIENNSIHINKITKIKPCLSDDFLEIISKY